MTYRQSKMYNLAKYLKNLSLQSVSSRRNLQAINHLPPEDSLWMKQTVVVSFRGILQDYIYILYIDYCYYF